MKDYEFLRSRFAQPFLTRFCAYNRPRYQVSVYRTIGPLVYMYTFISLNPYRLWQTWQKRYKVIQCMKECMREYKRHNNERHRFKLKPNQIAVISNVLGGLYNYR